MTSTLKSLIDDRITDKNTVHSYLDIYDSLFNNIRNSAKNVIEIGILEGGSQLLWHKYFKNANIYGCDINPAPAFLKQLDRMILYQNNAYDINFIKTNFSDNNIIFDLIIDDGPHTLESMLFIAKYYSPILSPNGILVIEDVPSSDWIQPIIDAFPDNLKPYVYVEDRRTVKGRYDDILIILDKSKIN